MSHNGVGDKSDLLCDTVMTGELLPTIWRSLMCCITVKREAICYSEVLIIIYQPVNCNTAKDRIIKTQDAQFSKKILNSL